MVVSGVLNCVLVVLVFFVILFGIGVVSIKVNVLLVFNLGWVDEIIVVIQIGLNLQIDISGNLLLCVSMQVVFGFVLNSNFDQLQLIVLGILFGLIGMVILFLVLVLIGLIFDVVFIFLFEVFGI